MKFAWINRQGVKSETGYVIQRIDRFHYHYVEGDRVLSIDVETGCRHEELCFSTGLWKQPCGAGPIPEEELGEIARRVSQALNFMGIGHRFVRTGGAGSREGQQPTGSPRHSGRTSIS